MPNGTYGGVRGRKTKVGRKLSFSSYSICILGIHGCYLTKKEPNLLKERLFLIHFFVRLWASMLQ